MPQKNYRREITEIKRDMASLAERLNELGGEAAEDIEEAAHDYYEKAKDTAGQAWDKTKEVSQKAKDHVEEHPWQSLAIGTAAGLLIGMLIGRRQR